MYERYEKPNINKTKFLTANDLAMHTNTNCETAFYFGEKSPFICINIDKAFFMILMDPLTGLVKSLQCLAGVQVTKTADISECLTRAKYLRYYHV